MRQLTFPPATGFDFGVAGTLTAFPAFQQKMGIPFPSQPSGYLIPANVCLKRQSCMPPSCFSHHLGPIRLVWRVDGR